MPHLLKYYEFSQKKVRYTDLGRLAYLTVITHL